MSDTKTIKLNVKDIVVDTKIQPRASSLDQEHCDELVTAYENKVKVPPPVVWLLPDKTYKLSQGFHRIEAMTRAKIERAEFQVYEGTELDCLVDAMTSNQGHGLKRTNKDKERAIKVLLGVLPNYSANQIADIAGVGRGMVQRLKDQVVEKTTCGDKVQGKDGRRYPAKRPTKQAETEQKSADVEPLPVVENVPHVPLVTESAQQVSIQPTINTASEQTNTDVNDSNGVDPLPVVVDEGEAQSPADEHRALMNRLCAAIDKCNADVRALKESPFASLIHFDSITSSLSAARTALYQSRPSVECPACTYVTRPECRVCRGCGHASEISHKLYTRSQRGRE